MMIAFRMITPLVTPQLKAEYDEMMQPHRIFTIRQRTVIDIMIAFIYFTI
jgi:hypothetical protein